MILVDARVSSLLWNFILLFKMVVSWSRYYASVIRCREYCVVRCRVNCLPVPWSSVEEPGRHVVAHLPWAPSALFDVPFDFEDMISILRWRWWTQKIIICQTFFSLLHNHLFIPLNFQLRSVFIFVIKLNDSWEKEIEWKHWDEGCWIDALKDM